MATCPNCGIDAGESKFCPECGTKIEETNPSTATKNAAPADSSANCADSAEPSAPADARQNNANPLSAASSQEYYEAMKKLEDEKNADKKKKKRKVIGCCSVLLALVLLISIVSNVKKSSLTTEEKAQVKEMISSIDDLSETVDLKDEEKVKALKKDFENLNEKQQKKVKNRKEIDKALEKIDSIKVNEVAEAINKIGTVTDQSGDVISAALEKYDKLPQELKEKVKNYDDLIAKRKEYDTLGAQKVIAEINGLGTVTLKSKDKIKEIDKMFNQLTDEGKKMVTNVDQLTAAKKAYNEAYKKECTKKLKDALSKLKATRDDIEKCTFYECASKPRYINDRSYILPYFRYNDDGTLYMRIRAVCVNDEWVFWKNLKIDIDGTTYEKSFNYFDIERDSNRKNHWEYADYLGDWSDAAALMLIAESKKSVMRFRGDAHSKDVTISAGDKAAIKEAMNVMLCYISLSEPSEDEYFDVS